MPTADWKSRYTELRHRQDTAGDLTLPERAELDELEIRVTGDAAGSAAALRDARGGVGGANIADLIPQILAVPGARRFGFNEANLAGLNPSAILQIAAGLGLSGVTAPGTATGNTASPATAHYQPPVYQPTAPASAPHQPPAYPPTNAGAGTPPPPPIPPIAIGGVAGAAPNIGPLTTHATAEPTPVIIVGPFPLPVTGGAGGAAESPGNEPERKRGEDLLGPLLGVLALPSAGRSQSGPNLARLAGGLRGTAGRLFGGFGRLGRRYRRARGIPEPGSPGAGGSTGPPGPPGTTPPPPGSTPPTKPQNTAAAADIRHVILNGPFPLPVHVVGGSGASGGQLPNPPQQHHPGATVPSAPGRAGAAAGEGGELAVAAEVGAGATATGGAGAAGGAAAGAGAAEAGGAAIAGGPVGVAVAGLVLVGVAAVEAGKQVYAFARSQEQEVRRLAEVGGQQAAATARLDAERLRRDIKTAGETGESSRGLTESISNFEEKLRPIESLLTNIANTIGGGLLDTLSNIIEPVSQAADLLNKIFELQKLASPKEWLKKLDELINGKKDEEAKWGGLPDILAEQAKQTEKMNNPAWPVPRGGGGRR